MFLEALSPTYVGSFRASDSREIVRVKGVLTPRMTLGGPPPGWNPPPRWTNWVEGFNTNNDVPYPPNGHSGNIISIKDVIKSNLVESLIPNKQRLSVQFPVRV